MDPGVGAQRPYDAVGHSECRCSEANRSRCARIDPAAKEPRAPASGPNVRAKTFWFLLGRLPKGTRRKGETAIRNTPKNGYTPTPPKHGRPKGRQAPKALSQIRIPRRAQRIALKLIPQLTHQRLNRLRRTQRSQIQATDHQIHLPRIRVIQLDRQRTITIHRTLTSQRRKTVLEPSAQLRKIHHGHVPMAVSKGRDRKTQMVHTAPHKPKNTTPAPIHEFAPL